MVYVESFPEPKPQTYFARGSHTTVGSSGAGKALNFAALGAEATLWAPLGADEEADHIRTYMAEHGVDMLSQHDPAGTMRHINLMDGAGDRISIFANSNSFELGIDLEAVRATAAAADVVSVTIQNPCRQFLPMLRKLGKPAWIDIHDYDGANPYHAEFIDAAKCLFMSSQAHPNWRGFLEERIEAGATVAVATHGKDGASGLTPSSGWVDIPAVPVAEIVDTNGAGDAFFAGFATSWTTRADLEAALQAGAHQAAKAISSTELAPL